MWRTSPLPKDWQRTRQSILDRDGHRCTAILASGERCKARATEVHHLGDANDHNSDMLQSLCDWHHKRETATKANASRRRVSQKRPAEKHPGLI